MPPIMLQWFKETLKERVKHELTSLWNAVAISFSSISQIVLMCSFSSCQTQQNFKCITPLPITEITALTYGTMVAVCR
jgi:hypothetical protein